MKKPVFSKPHLVFHFILRKTRRAVYVPMFFFLALVICISACEKNGKVIDAPSTVPAPLFSIGYGNYDIDWLIAFQTYLRDLSESNPTSNIYSAQDAVFGVEALLNIRYGNTITGIAIYSSPRAFDVPATSNWVDLLNTAQANLLLDISENTDPNFEPASFDIEIVSESASNVSIVTKTIFKENNTCTISNYVITTGADCDEAFEEGEEYLLGLDGDEYHPPYNPDCFNECGDYIPCQNEPGLAMEEIEKHINANYPEPDCGEGMVWDGTFSDVQTNYGLTLWYDGFMDCTFEDNDYDLGACDCLVTDALNCMYCALFDAIGVAEAPFYMNIPDGYHFISINLSVDNIPDPNEHPSEWATALGYSFTFGIPNCTNGIIGPWISGVLYMDISVYE